MTIHMFFSTVNTLSVPENTSLKNLGQILKFNLLSLLHLQKKKNQETHPQIHPHPQNPTLTNPHAPSFFYS